MASARVLFFVNWICSTSSIIWKARFPDFSCIWPPAHVNCIHIAMVPLNKKSAWKGKSSIGGTAGQCGASKMYFTVLYFASREVAERLKTLANGIGGSKVAWQKPYVMLRGVFCPETSILNCVWDPSSRKTRPHVDIKRTLLQRWEMDVACWRKRNAWL